MRLNAKDNCAMTHSRTFFVNNAMMTHMIGHDVGDGYARP
ncbi:hypothetical protein IMCC12053_1107 [Celeribacter marinus]|uniref:Uncharacterized protein n=1 Tax=Celeribacter marinus TaxID=1397108 RepID=A0A0P0A934_9RHOB|nr:hypothetical protein IMCC12053_1107 [Celeribacter marinus]